MIKLIEEKDRERCLELGMEYGKEEGVPVSAERLDHIFDVLVTRRSLKFIAGYFDETMKLQAIILVDHTDMSLVPTSDFSILHVILAKSVRGGTIFKSLIDFVESRCYHLGGDNLFVCASIHRGLAYYLKKGFSLAGTLFMKEITCPR